MTLRIFPFISLQNQLYNVKSKRKITPEFKPMFHSSHQITNMIKTFDIFTRTTKYFTVYITG